MPFQHLHLSHLADPAHYSSHQIQISCHVHNVHGLGFVVKIILHISVLAQHPTTPDTLLVPILFVMFCSAPSCSSLCHSVLFCVVLRRLVLSRSFLLVCLVCAVLVCCELHTLFHAVLFCSIFVLFLLVKHFLCALLGFVLGNNCHVTTNQGTIICSNM